MTTSALVPELPTALRPADLVPGEPEDVELLAAELRRFAQGAADTAADLRRLSLGGWQGQAATTFAHELGEAPKRLERAADAFTAAARVLRSHAETLVAAQDRASVAIGLWQDGEARSRAAAAAADPEAAVLLPDPGKDARVRAERLVLDARADVAASGRMVAAALDEAASAAPDKPGLLSSALGALSSFGKGALEATVGLAEFVYKLTPVYQAVDPEGYLSNLEMLGKGLAYGVQHPAEFGKALLDLQTWKDDPARALGHLVPDLLIALATAGGGAVARGAHGAQAMRAVGAVDRTAESVSAIRRTVDLLEDSGEVVWRGEGLAGEGLTLTRQGDVAAEAFHGLARQAEDSISPRMQHLMAEHGAKPLGWEYRLKDLDSLKRKVGTELLDRPDMHPVDALSDVKDNVRYTAGFPEADYTARSTQLAEAMKARGFTDVKFDTSWDGPGYKGVNSAWRDPETGHVFELQFHTPESYAAKTETHNMYKEMRLPGTPPERVAELARLQDEIFSRVPVPDGAPGLTRPVCPPLVDLAAGATGFAGAHAAGTYDRTVEQATAREAR